MSTIKILSPINNGRTKSIKLRTEDAPNILYEDNTPVNGPYEFYGLQQNNINDVVMHLDLREPSKSVNPPNPDYSEYFCYSSRNTIPGVPETLANGDSSYKGIWDTISIKKQSIKDFGLSIGNGFTLSMWVKISNKNPNWDWFRTDPFTDYSYRKTISCDLIGSISTSNNTSFGIVLNKGSENSRDSQIKGNTLFYLKSDDGKYTTSFIEKNILNDKWINLSWVGKIDNQSDKMVFNIFINGTKVHNKPIDQEITSSSTWGTLDNGLGIGLWATTDSDSGSEFVSLIDLLYNDAKPDYNTSKDNSHGNFIISTITLYKTPLSHQQIYSDYKYYKERYQ